MDGTARAAVLGGTFDPVHVGHLAIAEQVSDQLDTEVWMVPAGIPPHRAPARAPARDRLDMVRAAAAGHPRLRVLDLEMRRPGPSFTVDTMAQLEEQHPGTELWVVLGADAARDIGTWQGHETLLAHHRFALVNRAGVEELHRAESLRLGFPEERTRLLRVDSPPVSASAVRRRIAGRADVSAMVPAPVAAMIRERHLYRGVPGEAAEAWDNPRG